MEVVSVLAPPAPPALATASSASSVGSHPMATDVPAPFSLGPRLFSMDHHFFAEGNLEREVLAKQVKLDDVQVALPTPTIRCISPGCALWFSSTSAMQSHYHSSHANVCLTCAERSPSAASFPSHRQLEIHIRERHDPIFKALSQNQKMYDCLVEGCGRKFWKDNLRRLHLIEHHRFPVDFHFGPAKPPKKHRPAKELGPEAMSLVEELGKLGVDSRPTAPSVSASVVQTAAASAPTLTQNTLTPGQASYAAAARRSPGSPPDSAASSPSILPAASSPSGRGGLVPRQLNFGHKAGNPFGRRTGTRGAGSSGSPTSNSASAAPASPSRPAGPPK